MNNVIEAILSRRSVREFTDRHISDDDLALIAKCAVNAPSARNQQKWHFTVVHDAKAISALSKAVGTTVGAGDGYCFYAPDALIIASAARDYAFGVQDCACALENIFLAAHALGIGSVWINQLCGTSDEKLIRKELDALGVPSNDVVYGVAALGYPAENLAPRPNKDESKIIISGR